MWGGFYCFFFLCSRLSRLCGRYRVMMMNSVLRKNS